MSNEERGMIVGSRTTDFVYYGLGILMSGTVVACSAAMITKGIDIAGPCFGAVGTGFLAYSIAKLVRT